MPKARPTTEQITAALGAATAAVESAKKTRQRYARRDTPARAGSLATAQERCASAAKPFRSWLGMVAWGGIGQDDELAMKRAVEDLRYERRQIAKMLAPARRGPRD